MGAAEIGGLPKPSTLHPEGQEHQRAMVLVAHEPDPGLDAVSSGRMARPRCKILVALVGRDAGLLLQALPLGGNASDIVCNREAPPCPRWVGS